jgi:hypothetical protein
LAPLLEALLALLVYLELRCLLEAMAELLEAWGQIRHQATS